MTAKTSEENIQRMLQLHKEDMPLKDIALEIGCSVSNVTVHLRANGVIFVNKGRTKECTEEYVVLAIDLRNKGTTWDRVAKTIGFCKDTLRKEVNAFLSTQQTT